MYLPQDVRFPLKRAFLIMRKAMYEALTNASPSPTDPFNFSFRSGDKIDLDEEAAALLLKAGAIREISPKPPAKADASLSGSKTASSTAANTKKTEE